MPVDRLIWIFCNKCNEVKQVSPEPECVHVGLAAHTRSAAPIFTYYEGPLGEVSVPGKVSSTMPARLKKLGYVEKTINNSYQYASFCREQDNKATSEHARLTEAQMKKFEAQQKERRAELRDQIKSEYGKDFLEAAINASERGYRQNYSAGSFLEGFEYDSRYGGE